MQISETQQDFIEWSSQPDRTGSYAQWARDHSLSEETLRRWRKSDWYQDALESRMTDMYMGPEKILEVLRQLHKEALGGDTTAMRLYMQWVDKLNALKPPREDRAIESLTDEELEHEWQRANGRV